MTTWREQASAHVQDDLDRLLDFALNQGAELVAEHGEFAPFAVAVTTGGEIAPFGVLPRVGADNARLREDLFKALGQLRDDYRAAIVAADVQGASGREAMDFHLEHAEGPTMLVRAPYRLSSDSLEVDDRSAYSELARIWIG